MTTVTGVRVLPMVATADTRPEWRMTMSVIRCIDVDSRREGAADGAGEAGFRTLIRAPPGESGQRFPDEESYISEQWLRQRTRIPEDSDMPHYFSIYYFIRTVSDFAGGLATNVTLEPACLALVDGRWCIKQDAKSPCRLHWAFPGLQNPCKCKCNVFRDNTVAPRGWSGLFDESFEKPVLLCPKRRAVAGRAFEFSFVPDAVRAYAVVGQQLIQCEGDAFEHMVYEVAMPEKDMHSQRPVKITMAGAEPYTDRSR